MSDTDMHPSLPPDTIPPVAQWTSTSTSGNTVNDLLLRADNHTGYRRLRHIITEPGSNNSYINLSCNVHRGIMNQGMVNPNEPMMITISRASTYRGKSLFDRGANGNICGSDMRAICFSDRTLNVTGIDNHEMTNLRIGTFGGVITTQRGEAIAIFNQSACHPNGKSIISCLQVEDNGIEVHDKLEVHGGRQCIVTPDGYVAPLDAHQGLVYLKIRPFTDQEFERLPHVIFTRDIPRDPSR